MAPRFATRVCPGILGDLWTFDPKLVAWTKIVSLGPSPKSRVKSVIVSDENGTVYLFGGWGEVSGGQDWGGAVFIAACAQTPKLLIIPDVLFT
jgi:hypothetical protein